MALRLKARTSSDPHCGWSCAGCGNGAS